MCVVIALCPSAFYIYINVLHTILNNAAFFAFTFRVEKITLNACSSVFLWLWIVKCSESRTNDTKSSVNKISSELLVGRAWKCDFVLFSVLSLQRWLTTVTQPYNVNNNLKIRCDILCERFFSLHPFVKQNPLSFGCTEREESETRSKASASKSQKNQLSQNAEHN